MNWGEKATLLGGKATLDADIYDIEWTSLQATENVEGINQLVNAGNARIQGIETAFRYRVLPALTLGGSAAYTDARLTSTSPVLGVTYTGSRLPLSPGTISRWTPIIDSRSWAPMTPRWT